MKFFHKFFVKQSIFVDVGYESEIGRKLKRLEVNKKLFDPISDEVCKLLSQKLSQWKKETDQAETSEDISETIKRKGIFCW